MKIGILTYHCPPNFGAQLQVTSTVGYLRRNGFEPVVLNWYAKDLEEMYSKRIPTEQVECHNRYAQEALPLSKKCQSEDDLIEEINTLDLDAIIVGSDALFKYVPLKKRRIFSFRKLKYVDLKNTLSCELLDDNPFFGSFISHLKKKIPASVYAVSSQNCPYKLMTREERQTMANFLSNYQLITVRDVWTKQMIENITNRTNVRINPDPVFSFNNNCYLPIPSKEEILKKFELEKNYVLFSFRDKFIRAEYIKAIADQVEEKGLQAVGLPMPEGVFETNIPKQIPQPLSPIDWYALIIHSKGYIGERMHPIVVCLHNAIPFFSFDEYGFKQKKSFFSRELVYNPVSSKTYVIVRDAGFLKNLYSYQGNERHPNANHVVDALLSFDIEKCKVFASSKRQEYETAMEEIIHSLI